MQATTVPRAGEFLIATEPGNGGYFDRSVVLLLDHGTEGALGVRLNRPSELPIEGIDQLRYLEPHLSPPREIFEGGPVNTRAAVCLAQLANPNQEPLGWKRIFGDVGAFDLNTPPELVPGAFSAMRLFMGLSGWDGGQLESELAAGAWFRTDAHAEEVFGTPQDLWRRTLRRIGGGPALWSTWTPVPQYN